MFRKIISVVIAMYILLMCGCGNKITEGEVYEKEFKPSYTTTSLIPIVNGKTTTFIPMIMHYPDRWYIKIRSLNKNENGKYETAKYYVTEEVYNSYDIGDIFKYDKDRDFEEEPVTKERKTE